MILYHFTSLTHFPEIMREGLSHGEVPVSFDPRYDSLPQAVNLTKLSRREDQDGWGALENIVDKTRIRITVEIDRDKVENWKQIKQRLNVPRQVALVLESHRGAEPYNHFFFFGVIPPDQFKLVEFWEDGVYKPLAGGELALLIARIEDEKTNLVFGVSPHGYRTIQLREGVAESWLLDGGVGYEAF